MKVIFLSDTHSPPAPAQTKTIPAAQDILILKGDQVDDSRGPINNELLNQIPVRIITLNDLLNPSRLLLPHNHDVSPVQKK